MNSWFDEVAFYKLVELIHTINPVAMGASILITLLQHLA